MAQVAPRSTVHDVVIIGSGAGGGTVTKVLANLGVRVLLMEAGPMVSMGDFKMLHGPFDVWHRGAGETAQLYTTGQGTPINFNADFAANIADEPYTVAPGSQFRWFRSRVHRRPHESLRARPVALLRLRLQAESIRRPRLGLADQLRATWRRTTTRPNG